MAVFNKQDIHRTYRKIAKQYDVLSRLLPLIGFREKAYRKQAVAELQLVPGDTVVEIGCGTGMNFSLFRNDLGSEGRIVGVDLSEAMLAEALKKMVDNDWRNIDLVHCDAAEYAFPQGVDAIISTFSLVFMPDYEKVFRHASQALKPGKRFVILDQKLPSGSLKRYSFVFEMLAKPFAVTPDMSDRHPWKVLDKYLQPVSFKELYFGFCYLVVGEKHRSMD